MVFIAVEVVITLTLPGSSVIVICSCSPVVLHGALAEPLYDKYWICMRMKSLNYTESLCLIVSYLEKKQKKNVVPVGCKNSGKFQTRRCYSKNLLYSWVFSEH